MKSGHYNRKKTLDSLESKHHIKARDLGQVLNRLDRSTRTPKECAGLFDDYPDKGFCWDEGDTRESNWYPQGLTGSWDAEKDGKRDGRRMTAVSWYQREAPKGTRISFVDEEKEKYRHVALADVTGGDFSPLNAHAGGIAWVGNYLYVADSGKGIRVFDLRRVWKTDGGAADGEYWLKNGKVHAAGYDYVLPQVGSYRTSNDKTDHPCDSDADPWNSSVSVDRKTQRLVTGEFCGDRGDGDDKNGRIVRWPLDVDSGRLKSSEGEVTSKDWYYTTQTKMQGVATYGNKVNSTSSHGQENNGVWHPMDLEGKTTGDTLKEERHHYGTPVPGPEDVTYDKNDDNGRYWTLSEYPDARYVFPNDAGG